MEKARVLIVDDSSAIRALLRDIFDSDAGIEVVGEAKDPYEAREQIKTSAPNVLSLDIEMPRMDGLTFLRNLMRLNPLPVIMLSRYTQDGAQATLKALELGAVDYLAKPSINTDLEFEQFRKELTSKVKLAASCYQKVQHLARAHSHQPQISIQQPLPALDNNAVSLIAIGASTGGPEALRELFSRLPAGLPPIVICQHIPARFSGPLAERLNSMTPIAICEAIDNQVLQPGCAYIAPGNAHLRVIRKGNLLLTRLSYEEPINMHRPSVEALFDSVLEIEPKSALAVMLTGMGEDGSMAMKRLRDAGAYTICQDRNTSLVWGMPGAAVHYGAACEQTALAKISERIINHYNERTGL